MRHCHDETVGTAGMGASQWADVGRHKPQSAQPLRAPPRHGMSVQLLAQGPWPRPPPQSHQARWSASACPPPTAPRRPAPSAPALGSASALPHLNHVGDIIPHGGGHDEWDCIVRKRRPQVHQVALQVRPLHLIDQLQHVCQGGSGGTLSSQGRQGVVARQLKEAQGEGQRKFAARGGLGGGPCRRDAGCEKKPSAPCKHRRWSCAVKVMWGPTHNYYYCQKHSGSQSGAAGAGQQ